MIFQWACQDFPYWRIVVPHSIKKNKLFSLPGESPHRNLIIHPVFSITKESNCQTIFLSLPVKTLPQAKFPTALKCPVFQLLLTLFRWLYVNKYIFAI